jgi:outer membrane protein TolC
MLIFFISNIIISPNPQLRMQEILYNKTLYHVWFKFLVKTRFYRLFLLISLYLGLYPPVPAYSQSDSLYYYLEIAAKNNPVVQQKFSEYKAALQKVPQVGSLSDPELSLGIFIKPMELVSGNQVADLRLMQMFPWFGVLKNAKDEMSLMANAKFEIFRDAKSHVFYDVQRTWFDLYKIQKGITISEKNVEILKVIERLALVRFKSPPSGNPGSTSSSTGMPSGSSQTGSAGSSSGSSGLSDLYRIQMETSELENKIALLKNQEQTLSALFNSYLNRPPVESIYTNGTLSTDSLGLSLIAVSDSILAKNPILSMLEFEKLSIEARKKMVIAMGFPMVGLGMNYSIIGKNAMSASSMNGKDMVMPMVTVTLPIYRKKYKAMVNEANLLETATAQNYQATANSLQTEYYQAVQLFKDAQRRVRLYENQFQLASKSLDLILKSFSTSSSGLTDVLRVRQQVLDYELMKVEAVADFNTAVAWLKQLGSLEIDGI